MERNLFMLPSEELPGALPRSRRGTIMVAYDMDKPNSKLTVFDDGIDRLDGKSDLSKSGLGMTVIEALAKQLDAEVDIEMKPHGTKVSITHAPFASRLSAVA